MVQAELTVAAVVCCRDRFLMVEETVAGERVFNQPAGHVEPGESARAAAIREAREETGLDFTPSGLVGFYHWSREPSQPIVRVAFAGAVRHPAEPRALDADINAVHWLSADAVFGCRALRSPLTAAAVDDFLRRPVLALDRLCEL